ncbi:MAG: hypothetical protein PSW75_03885 [bacterium]|nr:hypothetical protein [bacterium]
MVCAGCNRAMLSKASGKISEDEFRYRYYSCKRKYADARDPKCPIGDIAAVALEKAIIGFLSRVGSHEAVVESLLGKVHDADGQRAQHANSLASLEHRLAKLNSQATNCVDVLAEEGAPALTDDLTRRIQRLGQRRQSLLVEREQQRQQLAAFENHVLSRERFRFALGKVGNLLPALAPRQKQDLLRTIFETITVCGEAQEEGTTAARIYRVAFKLRIAEFVTAMERGGVIDDRIDKVGPYARRVLDITAEFVVGPKKRIAVLHPFEAELGEPPATELSNEKPVTENPIHRALGWDAKLQKAPGLSVRALARDEEVSAALVCLYLKLLKLAPDILEFVRGLNTPVALRIFSYRTLLGLAKCDLTAQRRLFNELRRKLPLSTV